MKCWWGGTEENYENILCGNRMAMTAFCKPPILAERIRAGKQRILPFKRWHERLRLIMKERKTKSTVQNRSSLDAQNKQLGILRVRLPLPWAKSQTVDYQK